MTSRAVTALLNRTVDVHGLETRQVTGEARAMVELVQALDGRFSANHLMDIFKGSMNAQVGALLLQGTVHAAVLECLPRRLAYDRTMHCLGAWAHAMHMWSTHGQNSGSPGRTSMHSTSHA
jgi:hypothetical protein